jgi:hypothetical protein
MDPARQGYGRTLQDTGAKPSSGLRRENRLRLRKSMVPDGWHSLHGLFPDKPVERLPGISSKDGVEAICSESQGIEDLGFLHPEVAQSLSGLTTNLWLFTGI